MDILIPLGTGSQWQNNELRYCLRAIERYATGFDRIFVVGENPGFLTTDYTDESDKRNLRFFRVRDIPANKQAAIAYKVLWAFGNTDISDQIAFWNDDYVLTRDERVDRIPDFHRGSLAQSAIDQAKNAAYARCLNLTDARLRSLKVSEPMDYDVHYPIIYKRAQFQALAYLWAESVTSQSGYVVKSTYANLAEGTGVNAAGYSDCKIRKPYSDIDAEISERGMFSYSDGALWDTGIPIPEDAGLKGWLARKFPDKSRWEK